MTQEQWLEYYRNHEPYTKDSYIEIPNFTDKDWYIKEVVPVLIEKGLIPKDKLQVSHWYSGCCRNAHQAQWDGKKFWYKRYKFGDTFNESIDHFDSKTPFDVFIPLAEIECEDNLI